MSNAILSKIIKNILQDEERDELGFTPSDYYDMQKLKDREGKTNDTLLSGFDITPEQIELINNQQHPLHSVAVICFYDVNYPLLRRMSFRYLSPLGKNGYLLSAVSYEDLLQQVFLDLLIGVLKLPQDSSKISSAIYECFRFSAVGGLGVLENVI